MPSWILAALALFALVPFFNSAYATVIYGGGGTHVLESEIHDNVIIQDGSTLRVSSGGAVRGTGAAPGSFRAAAVRTSDYQPNSLEINDTGRVIAGENQWGVVAGLQGTTIRVRDDGIISGGILGDAANGWRREETATQRLYLQDRALVTGTVSFPGFVQLSDEATIAGDLGNTAAFGSLNVNMLGGTITQRLRLGGADPHIVNIQGGAVLGGMVNAASDVELRMTGGFLGGSGIDTIGNLNADIRGGEIQGGIRVASNFLQTSSHVLISGGQIDAAPDRWLIDMSPEPTVVGIQEQSFLEIWGGQFGYSEPGFGIRLNHFVDFDIYGWDWSFTDGWLSGYLADGNWFRSALTYGPNWQGSLRMHDVSIPEPGTFGLMLTALLVAIGVRRRSRSNAR
jgi:hypothetical protein